MKILIVDDEKEATDRLAEYMRSLHHSILVANDGLEGYKLYKDMAPDLVILDLNLPILNGIDILKRIRKEDKETQVVILSAHSEKEWIEKAMANHISKYIIKPIRRGDLKEMLIKVQNQTKGVKDAKKRVA